MGACAVLLLAAAIACAQSFPVKQVRLVVPNAPGSTTDLLARVIVPEMSSALGQSVVVENKAGANSKIGLDYVAKQMPADGYTTVIATAETLALLPFMVKDVDFDPVRDLPPFVGLVEGRFVLVSTAKAPWRTVNELVAYAKSNPGKLNFGASSPSTRLPMEVLLRKWGVDALHVPYSNGGAYATAIVSAEVQMGMQTPAVVVGMGDKMRVIAISGTTRSSTFPDAPTFAELGLSEISNQSFALRVRTGTPGPIVARLHEAASRALTGSVTKAGYAKLQYDIWNATPEAAAKSSLEQAAVISETAQKIGLKPE
jgi:tripartite-type tricarboxylate transporter receptor subunit TctC